VAQLAGKQAKETWDEKDIGFRRRRSGVAILMNELNKKLMSDPGCSYNYPEQMNPIRRRFMRDFRDGYARLLKVREGLRTIYGIDLADFPEITKNTPANSGSFDSALRWSREAIRNLIGQSHLDQMYVLSLSVSQTIGNAQFLRRLQQASETPVQFGFDIPDVVLRNQGRIRLRGVSAFIVTNRASVGVWRVSIRPPRKARGGSPLLPLDQNMVPEVRLGRVARRDSQQPADIAGAVVLRNVSVLGDPNKKIEDRQWLVTLDPTSNLGEALTSVLDLHIDLHLAVQAEVA
jgi:hypothetical protein